MIRKEEGKNAERNNFLRLWIGECLSDFLQGTNTTIDDYTFSLIEKGKSLSMEVLSKIYEDVNSKSGNTLKRLDSSFGRIWIISDGKAYFFAAVKNSQTGDKFLLMKNDGTTYTECGVIEGGNLTMHSAS